MNLMFGTGLFEILFFIIFVMVIVAVVVSFVQGIGEWNKNNHSPRLDVDARVISKRMSVSHHGTGDTCGGMTSTSYYVTFQVESGDRMEFTMSGTEYGQLAEGDFGILSFQGTRYLNFERKNEI